MSKHFTFSLMGLVMLVFAAYIFMAGSPIHRINHTCAPIAWAGRGATAIASVFSDASAAHTWHATADTFQGCRYVIFTTFYARAYKRAQKRAKLARPATAGSAR